MATRAGVVPTKPWGVGWGGEGRGWPRCNSAFLKAADGRSVHDNVYSRTIFGPSLLNLTSVLLL